jgi:hypothetical protein
MNETVKIWVADLFEITGKVTFEELTAEEIRAEIEEVEGTIENEKVWGNKHNIMDLEDYLGILNETLASKEGKDENI